MWQIAALVASADKVPPDVMDLLKQPMFPPPGAKPGTAGTTLKPRMRQRRVAKPENPARRSPII